MTVSLPEIPRCAVPRRVPRCRVGGAVALVVLMMPLNPWRVCAPAQAAAQTPGYQAESAVREILSRDLSTVLTGQDKKNDDRRFMSAHLYRLYTAKGRSFDADPYTGTQDASDYRIAKLASEVKSSTGAVVTVEFAVAGAPKSHPKVAYDMVLSGGRWLVQDIVYLGDGTSLHNILNGMR